MEQIDEGQGTIRHPAQHLQRVAMPDADVAQRRVLSMIPRDMDEGLRDAIHKGFGADEAVIGQHVGAHRHMLAAAETDLEMQRTIVAEQTRSEEHTSELQSQIRRSYSTS